MSGCTLAQVYADARARLNDVDLPVGEISTNFALQGAARAAYAELYDMMATVQTPRVDRVIYWILPAYDTVLSPVGSIGLNDFSEPLFLEERNSLTTVPIATTSTDTPIKIVTTAPHTLTTNQEVTVMGVTGASAPWGRWYVTVIDSVTLTLNGSVSDGAAGTGGTVCWSNENFSEMAPLRRTSDRAISDRLYDYLWINGVFQFRGATTTRQLRITYIASGVPPTQVNQPIGIDNCLNFLGCRTASLFANQKGWYAHADRLTEMALGPARSTVRAGGYLDNFLRIQVKSQQRLQRQRQRFRPNHQGSDWMLL